MSEEKSLVFSTIGINCVLGLADRIAQIAYYCTTDFKIGNSTETTTVRSTALTFCILPTGINLFMIIIYLVFHYESMLTPLIKLKFFFMYLASFEILFPIGVHRTFMSKYSQNSDNVLITMKVINALHIMFISLPQLLIVPIYSSAVDAFSPSGIASLSFAIIFIVWSIAYYFVCASCEESYDNVLPDYVNEK